MKASWLAATVILIPIHVVAQGVSLPAFEVDCALLSKKTDGTWFVLRQTTIKIGSSEITLPPGDIEPRILQFGMADISTALTKACPDKKSEPSLNSKP